MLDKSLPKTCITDSEHDYRVAQHHETLEKHSEIQPERLAVVAQKTQNAVIITNEEGYIQWVNEGFTELTGYGYDEVVGHLGYLLQGEKTDSEIVEKIRTTMWARKPYSGEIYSYKKDGTGFWMSISITPTYDDNGVVEGFVAVQMDITERKIMEEQLRLAHDKLEQRVAERTQEFLRANEALQVEVNERKRAEEKLTEAREFLLNVIDSVPNLIFVKDSDQRYTMANKATAKLYGTTIENMIGKTFAEFHEDRTEANQIASDDFQILENMQELFISEARITDGEGKVHWLQIVKRPLNISGDKARHILGVATDLTERKNLENQLRHAQKMESIGQLAAGIAHEINTPTQYVSDNTNFIRTGFEDVSIVLRDCRNLIEKINAGQFDHEAIKKVEQKFEENDIDYLLEEVPKAIDQSLEGVCRISKIVQSMRTFSHPGKIEKISADINKAIENTISLSHNEWKYVADLETNFDENLPLVPCLIDEFNQVILNMIINASHSIADISGETRSRGKIVITTSRAENKWAEIRISDTGKGIPGEYQNRIFDPFFTTKEVGKGTGQGLAISHNVIVEKHKGQLTFETEKNKGTTFIIRLPLENTNLS